MKRILLIEDEKDLERLMSSETDVESDHLDGFDRGFGDEVGHGQKPDIIILDVMMPWIKGIDVCKLLMKNKKTAQIPVVVLSKNDEENKWNIGKANNNDDKMLTIGLISINTTRHLVYVENRKITLTSTEYKLLVYLAGRLGRVQSRDILLENVWGYCYPDESRTVDTHIKRLRNKLGEVGKHIKTIRNFGYMMEVD